MTVHQMGLFGEYFKAIKEGRKTVEVRLNGGALGVLTSINFNYAQRILVAPEVVSPNVTACSGQTTQLVVNNPSSALTYRWYDSAGVYQTGKDGIILSVNLQKLLKFINIKYDASLYNFFLNSLFAQYVCARS